MPDEAVDLYEIYERGDELGIPFVIVVDQGPMLKTFLPYITAKFRYAY